MKALRYLLSLFLLLGLAAPAAAEVRTKTIEYNHDGTKLTGYLAWDDAIQGHRPGVLVVHEWWGLNDYARQRARMLAELGYAAFAVDMYGDGKVTEHGNEAGEWMKQITANVEQWQQRALLGLEVLRQQEMVDPEQVAAIGYCFGGATVMQMAYAGAGLKGVASFHGSLPTPTTEQMPNIRAAIAAFHGADDGFVPAERVQQFEEALTMAGADWQLTTFGGTKHSFTNPNAGDFGIDNLEYNARADQRSWAYLQLFFDEIFNRKTALAAK